MAKASKMLTKLYLAPDLSIDREVLEKGRFRHCFKTITKNAASNILMNLLFAFFCAPMIFLLIFLLPQLESGVTSNMNFAGDLGWGYLGSINDNVAGMTEVYKMRMIIFASVIPCFTLAGVGASGLFYCARNLAWGAKVKLRRHFWRGIRKYWWQFMICFTIIGIEVAAVACSILGYLTLSLTAAAPWWTWICMIFSCALLLVTMMFMIIYMPMITQYRIKERYKIKNSIILCVSTVIPLIISMIFMAIPLLLAISSTTLIFLYILLLLIGFSGYALAMTEYSQFCSDNFTKVLYEESERRKENEKMKAINQARKAKNKQINKNKGKKR